MSARIWQVSFEMSEHALSTWNTFVSRDAMYRMKICQPGSILITYSPCNTNDETRCESGKRGPVSYSLKAKMALNPTTTMSAGGDHLTNLSSTVRTLVFEMLVAGIFV